MLLGDFANVPYALGGVEWTLRIEVAFYALMGLLRAASLMGRFRGWLPLVLTGSVLGLGALAPLPAADAPLFRGCLTVYAPFLLVGVAFRLREAGEASGAFLLAFVLLVFGQYFVSVGRYQPHWLGAHFGGLAFLLFAAAWGFRRHVVATPLVLFASELTYAVYLFHNWAYEPIRDALSAAGAAPLPPEVPGLVGLFALCVIANRCVERPGARFGRALAKRIPRPGPVRLVLRRVPGDLNLPRKASRV